MFDSINVTSPGANISFTGTSASVAIPNTSAGTKPKYIRLAATQPCYVRLGIGAPTAVAGDLLIQPADSARVGVSAMTHVAALQVTSAGVLQISPLEDM